MKSRASSTPAGLQLLGEVAKREDHEVAIETAVVGPSKSPRWEPVDERGELVAQLHRSVPIRLQCPCKVGQRRGRPGVDVRGCLTDPASLIGGDDGAVEQPLSSPRRSSG